jgi:DNA-binding XRE family transcriptional regulator
VLEAPARSVWWKQYYQTLIFFVLIYIRVRVNSKLHLRELRLKKFTLTTEHVRAARMFLRWNQTELARKSGISLPTIARLEAKPGPLGGLPSTAAAIQRALENEGIRFFAGDTPGVRLGRLRFTPAVSAPGRRSKPVKTVRAVPKKRR